MDIVVAVVIVVNAITVVVIVIEFVVVVTIGIIVPGDDYGVVTTSRRTSCVGGPNPLTSKPTCCDCCPNCPAS